MMFDQIVIVDWSAAKHRKLGRDSIWICQHATDPVNLPTRAAAKAHLSGLLDEATRRGARTLIGFDFPFGYPAGFADRLGLAGAKPWRAVWDEIARLIEDNEANSNNRFHVGAELNRRVSGKQFPFWGCPASSSSEFLGTRHHQGHSVDEPLRERRLIDCWMTGAQPCWKLAYTGSVGSQALTGIPVVRSLRDDPRWADHARVWPFETALRFDMDARIVFAEVWPSWWREWRTVLRPGDVNDQAQVRYVAGILADHCTNGTIASLFAGDPSLTAEQRSIVENEEAWTLGVTAPRVRARRPPKELVTPGLDPGVHGWPDQVRP
jgi:hypothetical protein